MMALVSRRDLRHFVTWSVSMLMTILLSTNAPAADVEILDSFGFDGNDPVDGPTSLVFDAEGRCYLLSQKANEVAVFDRELVLERVIGAEGEGPGELQNTAAIVLHAGRLLVTTMGRTHRFTLDGTYESSIPSLYFTKLTSIHGQLIAVSSSTGPTFAVVDADLTVQRTFGPPSDWREEWKILAGPDGGFVAFERHDGHALAIDSAGTFGERVDLGLGRGWWKGSRGKHALSDVAFDPAGQRYLILVYPEVDAAPILVEMNLALEERARWTVPDELGADEVAVDSEGRVFISCYAGSMVYLVQAGGESQASQRY